MSNHNAHASTEVPRLFSLATIAERTNVPRPTWYTIVARGDIAAIRIGRTIRVDERDLIAYLAARREAGK